MTIQNKDLENIKTGVLSFLDKLDRELQHQLGILKIAICEFPGLKVNKMNILKEQWSVTIDASGENGAQSMLYIMDLFAQNPDLNVHFTATDRENIYVLNGPDPEVVTIWLRSILDDRLQDNNRVLH